jgi:hypothetical protein
LGRRRIASQIGLLWSENRKAFLPSCLAKSTVKGHELKSSGLIKDPYQASRQLERVRGSKRMDVKKTMRANFYGVYIHNFHPVSSQQI